MPVDVVYWPLMGDGRTPRGGPVDCAGGCVCAGVEGKVGAEAEAEARDGCVALLLLPLPGGPRAVNITFRLRKAMAMVGRQSDVVGGW